MTARKLRSALIVASCLSWMALAAGGGVADLQAAQGNASGGNQGSGRSGSRAPGQPDEREWWNDAEVQQQLALTAEKVSQIDRIYRRRSHDLAPVYKLWQQELATLDQMTKAAAVDEGTYSEQVDRVEFLRSEIVKSRMVMVYRMYRELSPDQYKKLQDIVAKRRAARNDRGPSR